LLGTLVAENEKVIYIPQHRIVDRGHGVIKNQKNPKNGYVPNTSKKTFWAYPEARQRRRTEPLPKKTSLTNPMATHKDKEGRKKKRSMGRRGKHLTKGKTLPNARIAKSRGTMWVTTGTTIYNTYKQQHQNPRSGKRVVRREERRVCGNKDSKTLAHVIKKQTNGAKKKSTTFNRPPKIRETTTG